MFTPLGDPRKLPYPLKEQVSNGNVTDDLGLEPNDFIWPEDPEERTILPLFLSQREFTAILSSVDVGSDIAYPEQYIEVYWLLVRNLRYSMDLCAIIADCIASNPTTQSAIRNFIMGDPQLKEWGEGQIPIIPAAQLSTNFGAVIGCNPDNLFNVATIAVDLLNSATMDIFDNIEVGTNALERADILVSGIPVIGGLLPFDEAISLAEKIASSFQEAYLEAYNETLKDDIRCGLFCAAKDECNLTIADMIAWYEEQFAHSLPQDIVEAFDDIASFLVAGTFSGATIVYGMHLFVLSGIRLAQDMFGFNFADLGLRLTAAADEGNNDWEVLCEECGADDPCENYLDLLVNSHGFTPLSGNAAAYGSWVSGEGLKAGATQFAFNTTFPVSGPYYIRLVWNEMPGGTAINWRQQNGTYTGPGTFPGPVLVDGKWTVTFNKNVPISTSIYMGITGTIGNPDLRIIGICYQSTPFT